MSWELKVGPVFQAEKSGRAFGQRGQLCQVLTWGDRAAGLRGVPGEELREEWQAMGRTEDLHFYPWSSGEALGRFFGGGGQSLSASLCIS